MINTVNTNGSAWIASRLQIKQCFSSQWCHRCQKQHHTLQHVKVKARKATSFFLNFAVSSISLFSFSLIYPSISPTSINNNPESLWMLCLVSCSKLVTHCAHSLLVTACVLISSPRSASIQAWALLDSASSSSFISEHLTQLLQLPCSKHSAQITGIGGIEP